MVVLSFICHVKSGKEWNVVHGEMQGQIKDEALLLSSSFFTMTACSLRKDGEILSMHCGKP